LAPESIEAARGFYMATIRADQFRAKGLPTEIVQDYHSRSARE